MRSATEPAAAPNSPAASHLRVRLERWNRKLHYYAGLFLLFFLWLFAVRPGPEPSDLELCGILEQTHGYEF